MSHSARPEPRRPVTVVQTPNGGHILYCDDGSVWKRDPMTGRFSEALPPLPGSRREAELEPRAAALTPLAPLRAIAAAS